ncbi:MAG: type VI secretion system baseplate subunit TssG, partial [Candidatus Eisenbacteria bacterium]|nr:type VI secretion system baseplate subunit TssG [Candidatus Eisenbacteria bacterium]
MASPHRQTDHSLNEKLKELSEHPYRFRFYQAMRLLEAAYSKEPKFGESLKLTDNTMRLGQEPSLAFAPSSISKFGKTKGGRPKMDVLFFGVFGANGPLPHHLTEYVRDRVRNHDDHTIARFVDIFHHRALALFYRAWANSEPAVSLDRPEEDRFDLYLGALGGLGLDGLKERDGVPDYAKRHYAGILGNATKNAEGLESMVSHFFGVPAKVAQFVGQWMDIPEDSWCRLGGSPETCALGTTATLGQKTWDLSQKFRLVIG